jgi:hypothetical protein
MGLGEPPRLGDEAIQDVEESAVLACNNDQAEIVYQSGMRDETNSVNRLLKSQGTQYGIISLNLAPPGSSCQNT